MSRTNALAAIASLTLFGAAGSLGVASPAHAATLVVTNCNNSGTGSLRAAAAAAASGDTIDVRSLGCNPINVTSGHILLPQSSISILGRDRLAQTIRGNATSRVLRHTGTGTLRVTGVSVSYGHHESAFANGGCVSSEGNVELRTARVHHCSALANGGLEPSAVGGGVFARGNLLLSQSQVFANQLLGEGEGGGVGAFGRVTLDRSVVYENTAQGNGGGIGANGLSVTYSMVLRNVASRDGGGAFASGDLTINKSTFAGNQAGQCGAVCSFGAGTKRIHDSTISGNSADAQSGVFVSGLLQVLNSTIAFNHEVGCFGALEFLNLAMESSIVAGNTCEEGPDLDVGGFLDPLWTFTGSHNLIGTSVLPPPADTIIGNPLLGPLAENGGPTRTHALGAGSPAIDRGNNVLGRAYDQRGPGFPRVRGAQPDIGAVER